MSLHTYRGSCHCQRVTFDVQLDLSLGSERCNCTYCSKVRNWVMIIKPSALQVLTGQDSLTDYLGLKRQAHQLFCKVCGVRTWGKGHLEQVGGDYLSVNLACLDDVPPERLMEAPVRYGNGRENDWMHAPAYTKHL